MWSRFNVDEEWWSWDVVGDSVEMINWSDGMDSVGEGYYPIGHKCTLSGVLKIFTPFHTPIITESTSLISLQDYLESTLTQ